MSDHCSDILDDLVDYCDRAGLSVATVCVRALGDSRFAARERRRREKQKRDAKKLREFFEANPVPAETDAVEPMKRAV